MPLQAKKRNDSNKIGIWRYARNFPKVGIRHRLTLGEGKTPLQKLDGIFYKKEYENPTGSVKDRSFAYQISALLENNTRSAAISSSGNAGVSAAAYCRLGSVKLTVCVSPKINRKKLSILEVSGCDIIESKTPVKEAFRLSQKTGVVNLRQSLQDDSLYGYETIAYELAEELPEIDSVFIPVSSATILTGIGRGFEKLGMNVSLHAVQSQSVNTVAGIFDSDFTAKDTSIADAIVARYTPRKDQATDIIKKSRGSGWVVGDEEIIASHNYLKKNAIATSYEGAMALAGYRKSVKKGNVYRSCVILLTGRYYG